MKKIFILTAAVIFCGSLAAQSQNTSKPDDHNTSWISLHGKSAKVDEASCLACHDERLECIACHEDMPPRNHSIAWVQKNHGLESRWNRMACAVCHREDFCTECHETAVPVSHARSGFATLGAAGFHCSTSCQLPYGSWQNTPSKNCITCHKVRPILKSGVPHAIN